MTSREVIAVQIVLQKDWFKACKCIFFTKDSPHANLIIYITAVKLMGFHFLELADELFVDGEILLAVCPW